MNILDRTAELYKYDNAIAYWEKSRSRKLAASAASPREDRMIQRLREMKEDFLRKNGLDVHS